LDGQWRGEFENSLILFFAISHRNLKFPSNIHPRWGRVRGWIVTKVVRYAWVARDLLYDSVLDMTTSQPPVPTSLRCLAVLPAIIMLGGYALLGRSRRKNNVAATAPGRAQRCGGQERTRKLLSPACRDRRRNHRAGERGSVRPRA